MVEQNSVANPRIKAVMALIETKRQELAAAQTASDAQFKILQEKAEGLEELDGEQADILLTDLQKVETAYQMMIDALKALTNYTSVLSERLAAEQAELVTAPVETLPVEDNDEEVEEAGEAVETEADEAIRDILSIFDGTDAETSDEDDAFFDAGASIIESRELTPEEVADAQREAEAAKAKCKAEADEAKRIADVQEAQRIADAEEAKRVADEAEAKKSYYTRTDEAADKALSFAAAAEKSVNDSDADSAAVIETRAAADKAEDALVDAVAGFRSHQSYIFANNIVLASDKYIELASASADTFEWLSDLEDAKPAYEKAIEKVSVLKSNAQAWIDMDGGHESHILLSGNAYSKQEWLDHQRAEHVSTDLELQDFIQLQLNPESGTSA